MMTRFNTTDRTDVRALRAQLLVLSRQLDAERARGSFAVATVDRERQHALEESVAAMYRAIRRARQV